MNEQIAKGFLGVAVINRMCAMVSDLPDTFAEDMRAACDYMDERAVAPHERDVIEIDRRLIPALVAFREAMHALEPAVEAVVDMAKKNGVL